MKRVVLLLVGTVAALVALLSFKSHEPARLHTIAPISSPAATAGTAAPPDPSAPAEPQRVTTGRAVHTRYGIVQVRLTSAGERIVAVSFAQLTAVNGRSQRVHAQIGPALLREAVAAQGADIDGVSGATYTSAGYRESLQSALDLAALHR